MNDFLNFKWTIQSFLQLSSFSMLFSGRSIKGESCKELLLNYCLIDKLY